MKQLIIASIFCLLLFSCKKLDQQDFYLENNCASCQKALEKESLKIEGIYYVAYEWEVGKLTVKYDPTEFQKGVLYDFLQQHHYLNPHDSLQMGNRIIQPTCCVK